ncbi:Amyloid beta A4 protein-binding family B member 1 [Fasciolopsis buskii]|uniref:Amyloid beta A4 protein-binding family B member 1 n=1 Tax=Fasciolopsis buskii TaxID=27845 RepID=A0A8E0VGJ0_9TREM|nr:Amyloid beta A4 protein-binding family B member 1 [Fasciolopsis buski]
MTHYPVDKKKSGAENQNFCMVNEKESQKVISCFYGGSVPVTRPFGIQEVNDAIEQTWSSRPSEQWNVARACISPSKINITVGTSSIVDCRISCLSFFGIAQGNIKLCGFIQRTVFNAFVCHVLMCEPNAGHFCHALKAACELRYQQFLDSQHDRDRNRQSGYCSF